MTYLHQTNKANCQYIVDNSIDVKAGDMTYAQRIELGKIFEDQTTTEVDKFEKTFLCLYTFKPSPSEYIKLIAPFKAIVEGLKHWVECEQKMLDYTPSTEEIQAGVKELSERAGYYSTIKALAKAYGKDPDDILQWKYAKVFGILYTDLEEFKYQKRLHKIMTSK